MNIIDRAERMSVSFLRMKHNLRPYYLGVNTAKGIKLPNKGTPPK